MRAITTALATLLLASVAEAKAPQAPTPPQAPALKSLCPCSQSGTCPCTPGNDCGCLTSGQYRWVATSNANQTALYRGTTQLGNWWHDEREYRRLIDRPGEPDVWACEACPVTPPTRQARPVVVPPAQTYAPAYRPLMLAPSYGGGFGGSCGGGG